MLDNQNFLIDPSILVQHHHQSSLPDTDIPTPSRTTSTSSLPLAVSTPDTDLDAIDQDSYQHVPKLNPRKRPRGSKTAATTLTTTTTTTTRSRSTRRGSKTAATTLAPSASITMTKHPNSSNSDNESSIDGNHDSSSSNSSSKNTNNTASVNNAVAEKRRKRNLERNRAAASKCRQRKKLWQDGLERKNMELENRCKALYSESRDLMDEIAQLKIYIMAHAACNDANINNWIRNDANSYVHRMSLMLLHQQQQQQHQEFVRRTSHQSLLSDENASLDDASLPAEAGAMAMETASNSDTANVNDEIPSMFAFNGSKAPFDTTPDTDTTTTTTIANPLRSAAAAADTTTDAGNDGASIFNQDLLLLSYPQA